MFLSEPPDSAYDLRFVLFGFRVRIAWTFWLAALIFGYYGAVMIDNVFATTSPSLLPWLVLWCAVMFVSILLHELGHAVAFRLCGADASVVLYHFGGLAIPSGQRAPGNYTLRLKAWENIFVAAAGPLVQLVLAAVVIIAVRASGYALAGGSEDLIAGGHVYPIGPGFISQLPGVRGGTPITDPGIFAAVEFLIFINVLWPLLNLVPVWPLDGGRITREVIRLSGGTMDQSLQLSMLAAGGLALWFLSAGQFFGMVLFASLALSSYQLLGAFGGRRF